ncbi:uncharacterized protein LOC110983874 [Acanthaster planci]|uniref:Uncharacterized protein LOC110983874 n=1 Tax=Acanthaster planci TaxID=133434 RepID=A0A8B7Z7B2_ACAPL|nr:uncharacterized protein LOC110983874 [Acanthaster planci]
MPGLMAHRHPFMVDTFEDGVHSSCSLVQPIREAARTSSTPTQFFLKLRNILLSSVLWPILIAILMVVSVSMVAVGAIYKDDCLLEPKIPIFLIVTGACYFPETLIALVVWYRRVGHPEDKKSSLCRVVSVLQRIGLCLLLLFMIVGNVLVYGNYPPGDDEASNDYCYEPLYYLAFWLMTATFIAVVVSCLFVGAVTLCLLGSSFCQEKT